MSNAYQCDRCEKLYTKTTDTDKVEDYHIVEVKVYPSYSRDKSDQQDICDICLDQLVKMFLNREK